MAKLTEYVWKVWSIIYIPLMLSLFLIISFGGNAIHMIYCISVFFITTIVVTFYKINSPDFIPNRIFLLGYIVTMPVISFSYRATYYEEDSPIHRDFGDFTEYGYSSTVLLRPFIISIFESLIWTGFSAVVHLIEIAITIIFLYLYIHFLTRKSRSDGL